MYRNDFYPGNRVFGGFFVWEPDPAMIRGFSCLCTQELLLVVLWGPNGMTEIEPKLAMYKASSLPVMFSLAQLSCFKLF